MAYATVADYETRFGPVPASDVARVEAWLSDVSAVITARLDSTPDADVARMVTVSAVNRIITSPGNVRTSAAGAISVTYAVVGRFITDEEWEMLQSSPIGSGAYTVSVVEETGGWSPAYPRWY
ncbi:MAG: hypothetical protein ACRD0P_12600 [Stackebrandtia sp.]